LIITGGGIGDIVCLIPLLRKLHADDHRITLIYNGGDPIDQILNDQNLLEHLLIRPSHYRLFRFMLGHLSRFQNALVTHLSDGKMARFVSFACAKHVIRSAEQINVKTQHEIAHYLSCFYGESHAWAADTWGSGWVKNGPRTIPEDYILIQPFAGNGKAMYKQWNLERWGKLLAGLHTLFPQLTFVLTGEQLEEDLFHKLGSTLPVCNKVGKTSLRQLRDLAAHCRGYVGVDTGLMHLVASYGRPTITIWGGSNEERFGYHLMDPVAHVIIQKKLSCHPCNDWATPNRSRVSSPSRCPDFACIRDVTPEEVLHVCNRSISAWLNIAHRS